MDVVVSSHQLLTEKTTLLMFHHRLKGIENISIITLFIPLTKLFDARKEKIYSNIRGITNSTSLPESQDLKEERELFEETINPQARLQKFLQLLLGPATPN